MTELGRNIELIRKELTILREKLFIPDDAMDIKNHFNILSTKIDIIQKQVLESRNKQALISIIGELCDFIDHQVYNPVQEYIKTMINELHNRGYSAGSYNFGYLKEKLKQLIEIKILGLLNSEE